MSVLVFLNCHSYIFVWCVLSMKRRLLAVLNCLLILATFLLDSWVGNLHCATSPKSELLALGEPPKRLRKLWTSSVIFGEKMQYSEFPKQSEGPALSGEGIPSYNSTPRVPLLELATSQAAAKPSCPHHKPSPATALARGLLATPSTQKMRGPRSVFATTKENNKFKTTTKQKNHPP